LASKDFCDVLARLAQCSFADSCHNFNRKSLPRLSVFTDPTDFAEKTMKNGCIACRWFLEREQVGHTSFDHPVNRLLFLRISALF
jgi:uncharacterized protein YodC (DUF2158 family)